jgi:hypothetical protein
VKQQKAQQWALNEMAKWLSHPMGFGEKPVRQRIVYDREVSWPWEEHPVRIFLVEYRMKKGFKGIGLTGPTTWSFTAVDDWDSLNLEDLICCYAGWYIQFFFSSKSNLQTYNSKNINHLVNRLIEKGVIDSIKYEVCDVFKVGEGLTYYAIKTLKNGELVYIVGTEDYYTFYKKDLPQMQLPPLFYFLGKTFNPFRED